MASRIRPGLCGFVQCHEYTYTVQFNKYIYTVYIHKTAPHVVRGLKLHEADSIATRRRVSRVTPASLGPEAERDVSRKRPEDVRQLALRGVPRDSLHVQCVVSVPGESQRQAHGRHLRADGRGGGRWVKGG